MAAIPDARSESEAVHLYIAVLQRAIAAFAENVFFIRGGYIPVAAAHRLLLAGDAAMTLRDPAGERRLALVPEFFFRAVRRGDPTRRWAVQTVGYAHRLGDLSAGRQLVGYHWHPHVEGIPYPHVHLLAAPAELRRLHIAVGHCTVAHALTFAMRDFGVQPVRDDWPAALDVSDAVLRQSISE